MLEIAYQKDFLKFIAKIKNQTIKEQVKNQIEKITNNPEIGKPMHHARKGTREVYISPYRLAYTYDKNHLVFLDIYHKDEQ